MSRHLTVEAQKDFDYLQLSNLAQIDMKINRFIFTGSKKCVHLIKKNMIVL